jgi:flavin reductase ActVB
MMDSCPRYQTNRSGEERERVTPQMRGEVDAGAFKELLADFPAAIVLVTTSDRTGTWKGFTASSFCGVSLTPPIVSTCLYETAECYEAFRSASRFCISFLHGDHADVATRFATRGAEKFDDVPFLRDGHGVPYLADARSALSCELLSTTTVGDHEVLFGEVIAIHQPVEPEPTAVPLLYWRRRYAHIAHTETRLERTT